MKITAKLLKSLGACKGAIKRFTVAFPRGAEITQGNIVTARYYGLNAGWLIRQAKYCIIDCEIIEEMLDAFLWAIINDAKEFADKLNLKEEDSYDNNVYWTVVASFEDCIERDYYEILDQIERRKVKWNRSDVKNIEQAIEILTTNYFNFRLPV